MLEPIDPNRDSILFIERNQDGNLEEFNIDRKRLLDEFQELVAPTKKDLCVEDNKSGTMPVNQ